MADEILDQQPKGAQIHDTHDLSVEFIQMCGKSEDLQKEANTRRELGKIQSKEVFVKDKASIGDGLIWIPSQKQLLTLLGISDDLPNNLFLEQMTELFEDIKKTTKSYPWINSMEKAMLHQYMEFTHKKFWNIKYKIWEQIH